MMNELIRRIQLITGRDLSVYDDSFLSQIVNARIEATGAAGFDTYCHLVENKTDEAMLLMNSLLVNHSLFFRGDINFALLNSVIFPSMLKTAGLKNRSARIWSAGCAEGQEAWSLAMLAHSLNHDLDMNVKTLVFGTDISQGALDRARKGVYELTSVAQVRYRFLNDYFQIRKNGVSINDHFIPMVSFSYCDLTDKLHKYPPDSIFGNFDLVACCNVLMYYNEKMQQQILDKLWNALLPGGFLMVGENERLFVARNKHFRSFGVYGGMFKKL